MRAETTSYRPDIDGLRGLAVAMVVSFHAGVASLPGGFAGVDVFFVISGYLITLIIDRDIRAGKFTYRHFYERRIRRIAPALLLVTAVSSIAALIFLLPFELDQFARSAIATMAMASNIYFWRTGDYFALTRSIIPLLHTWSLGVEEQFYLLYPATLILAQRLRVSRLLIGSLAVGGFVLAAIASFQSPVAAFYLLPTRGWELMIGGSLAVGLISVPERMKAASGALGLTMIGAGAIILSDADLFPGWGALLPTIGAALVIGSEGKGPASDALSLRPVVYVGKISYSLYLWHWPILAFLRQWQAVLDLPSYLSLFGVALAFSLSAISYRFVEQPCRKSSTPFQWVLLTSIAVIIAIGLASVVAIATSGLPQRLPRRVAAIAEMHNAYAPLAHACTDVGFDFAIEHCHVGPPGKPRFLLWGDSHAAAISEGAAEGLGEAGIIMSTGGCPATLGWAGAGAKGRGRTACISKNALTLTYAERDPSIRIIVLSAYWPNPAATAEPGFWSATQQLVDRLRASGKTVLVVAGEPASNVDVPWASAIRERFGRKPLVLACPHANVPLRGITLVDPSAGFCAIPAYRALTDSNHPSRYAGLAIIAPAIRRTPH